jgi:hypothetical protein
MSKQPMIFRCRNGMCHNEINPEKNLFCESCRERTSEKDVKFIFIKSDGTSEPVRFLRFKDNICDVPIFPTKGEETSRND